MSITSSNEERERRLSARPYSTRALRETAPGLRASSVYGYTEVGLRWDEKNDGQVAGPLHVRISGAQDSFLQARGGLAPPRVQPHTSHRAPRSRAHGNGGRTAGLRNGAHAGSSGHGGEAGESERSATTSKKLESAARAQFTRGVLWTRYVTGTYNGLGLKDRLLFIASGGPYAGSVPE